MHMADALLSPAVGGVMWAATAGVMVHCSRKLRDRFDSLQVPLMGVLAAFVFAAQMINFTIPATGSSGHLGGGLILAVLLGPHAAFLAIASVLTVQALFFADGGLLALGCNIFNLGVFPCFVAYPFIYRKIVGDSPSQGVIVAGSVAAAVAGLQLGAFCVVLQTAASGISELPFSTFLLLMQPIHLAIGVVEGLVTAAVVGFVVKARPEVLALAAGRPAPAGLSLGKVLAGLVLAAALTGGVLSWFASAYPDGLEWSMAGVSGKEELEAPEHGIHETLAGLQEKTAFLPDYGFKAPEAEAAPADPAAEAAEAAEAGGPAWPAVDPGTSVSGLVGGALTLLLAGVVGLLLKRRARSA
ncbi:MAG: energy-coupling factor ABC transporter permease [Thermodesulfobacteriota bacterium]